MKSSAPKRASAQLPIRFTRPRRPHRILGSAFQIRCRPQIRIDLPEGTGAWGEPPRATSRPCVRSVSVGSADYELVTGDENEAAPAAAFGNQSSWSATRAPAPPSAGALVLWGNTVDVRNRPSLRDAVHAAARPGRSDAQSTFCRCRFASGACVSTVLGGTMQGVGFAGRCRPSAGHEGLQGHRVEDPDAAVLP